MTDPTVDFERACDEALVHPSHRPALLELYRSWPQRSADVSRVEQVLDDYGHYRLFQASRLGDAAAARRFEAYWRTAAVAYLGRGFTREQVDELSGAFFGRVYERVSSFDFAIPFITYLRTILLNIARDEIRRLRKKHERERAIDEDEAVATSIRDPAVSAEEQVLASERAVRLRRALARLAPADRRILLEFVVEGTSGDDVAAALGIGRDAVYQRLRRARLRLRALVDEESEK